MEDNNEQSEQQDEQNEQQDTMKQSVELLKKANEMIAKQTAEITELKELNLKLALTVGEKPKAETPEQILSKMF